MKESSCLENGRLDDAIYSDCPTDADGAPTQPQQRDRARRGRCPYCGVRLAKVRHKEECPIEKQLEKDKVALSDRQLDETSERQSDADGSVIRVSVENSEGRIIPKWAIRVTESGKTYINFDIIDPAACLRYMTNDRFYSAVKFVSQYERLLAMIDYKWLGNEKSAVLKGVSDAAIRMELKRLRDIVEKNKAQIYEFLGGSDVKIGKYTMFHAKELFDNVGGYNKAFRKAYGDTAMEGYLRVADQYAPQTWEEHIAELRHKLGLQ